MPSSTRPNACQHRPLARGPVARVDHCAACDAVSIHLGSVTIRLDEAACESLVATLSEALVALQRPRGEPIDLFWGPGAPSGPQGLA